MYGRQLCPNPTEPEVIYMSMPVQAHFRMHSEGLGEVWALNINIIIKHQMLLLNSLLWSYYFVIL